MDGITPPLGQKSVLIVEDDASLLSALVFDLETDGFIVYPFDRAKSLLAAPVRADCMVIDMKLPDVDGLSVISRLRQAGVRTPAILTTTNPDARTRRSSEAMGVRIVEKPLITGELLACINTLIAARAC
jgi:two-component system response regulator FixJ